MATTVITASPSAWTQINLGADTIVQAQQEDDAFYLGFGSEPTAKELAVRVSRGIGYLVPSGKAIFIKAETVPIAVSLVEF